MTGKVGPGRTTHSTSVHRNRSTPIDYVFDLTIMIGIDHSGQVSLKTIVMIELVFDLFNTIGKDHDNLLNINFVSSKSAT